LTAAADAIKSLKRKAERVSVCTKELAEIWAAGEQRVLDVAAAEPSLARQLEHQRRAERGDGADGDAQERASDVSEWSQQSYLSTASARSDVSSASVSSSTSSEFSIHGVEHGLLSRGVGGANHARPPQLDGGGYPSDLMGKKKRKPRVKGEGRDLCGLKVELKLCEELWSLSSLSSTLEAIQRVCSALLIFGEVRLVLIVKNIHDSVQSFLESLSKDCSALVAPCYPDEWLQLKGRSVVGKFKQVLDIEGSPPSAEYSDRNSHSGSGANTKWKERVHFATKSWDKIKIPLFVKGR